MLLMTSITKGYKATNLDMTCFDFQFEMGKSFTVDNDKPLEVCTDTGFHFCQKLEDVFDYYDWHTCRVFEVEVTGEVVTEGNKSIAKTITFTREITPDELKGMTFTRDHLNAFFNELSDEELIRLYAENSDQRVRQSLILKLTDEQTIIDLFAKDVREEVRRTLVERISDEQTIVDLFADDKHWFVRKTIVKKITDEQVIVNLFAKDEHWCVRKAVVEKISDEQIIADLFAKDKHWHIRRAVINKLSDEQLIANLFANDEHCIIRHDVIGKLTDEQLITDLFADDEHWFVRISVIARLSDEQTIVNLFSEDEDPHVRQAVVELLAIKQLSTEDEGDRKDLAKRVKAFRQKCISKIEDELAARTIARTSSSTPTESNDR